MVIAYIRQGLPGLPVHPALPPLSFFCTTASQLAAGRTPHCMQAGSPACTVACESTWHAEVLGLACSGGGDSRNGAPMCNLALRTVHRAIFSRCWEGQGVHSCIPVSRDVRDLQLPWADACSSTPGVQKVVSSLELFSERACMGYISAFFLFLSNIFSSIPWCCSGWAVAHKRILFATHSLLPLQEVELLLSGPWQQCSFCFISFSCNQTVNTGKWSEQSWDMQQDSS